MRFLQPHFPHVKNVCHGSEWSNIPHFLCFWQIWSPWKIIPQTCAADSGFATYSTVNNDVSSPRSLHQSVDTSTVTLVWSVGAGGKGSRVWEVGVGGSSGGETGKSLVNEKYWKRAGSSVELFPECCQTCVAAKRGIGFSKKPFLVFLLLVPTPIISQFIGALANILWIIDYYWI